MRQNLKIPTIVSCVFFFGMMFILGPEQLMNNQGLLVFLLFIAGCIMVGPLIWNIFFKPDVGSEKKFQDKMDELGYTKRKVVYDFLAPNFQKEVNTFRTKYWWTVGIWLNYNEKKVILRTEKENWTAKVIPFSSIQSVEMIEDGYTEISGAAVGFGGLAVGSATSTSFVKGLKIRIVKGDVKTGTEAFFINLYDPEWGSKFNKSDPSYKAIQECGRSIADEIIYIINHT